jgi:hypothetical protein
MRGAPGTEVARRTGTGVSSAGGSAIAVAGAVFSLWLLATRSSTELWVLLAVIAAGVRLRQARRDT